MGSEGGRRTRALRLLLSLVLALAALEYLCASILEASPLRTYIFVKIGNKSATIFGTISLQDTRDNTTVVTDTTIDENPIVYEATITQTMAPLPLCNLSQESLGPIPVHNETIKLRALQKKFPEIRTGGRYSPSNCTAMHKVAIIVPYRARYRHLLIFLNHMHPFLMKQQIEYGIFIVEQHGWRMFNRAKLFNVGFMEAQRLKAGGWQCFIFHDIDLLPMNSRNLYTCPRQPRHMSASIDKFGFRLPYNDIFGGVSALTVEQFVKVNGFSNKYWGWGGEDDDMSFRLRSEGYNITRYVQTIARYASLPHESSETNPYRYKLLTHTHQHYHEKDDGLTTLVYRLLSVEENHLFTHILANIDKSKSRNHTHIFRLGN